MSTVPSMGLTPIITRPHEPLLMSNPSAPGRVNDDVGQSLMRSFKTRFSTMQVSGSPKVTQQFLALCAEDGMQRRGETHQATQVYGLGQCARAVRIGGCGHGACRPCRNRRSPERVWTLLLLPLEFLPTALTVKGAGGEGQHGRRPTLVLLLPGWSLFW
jgi:hypothetical protein